MLRQSECIINFVWHRVRVRQSLCWANQNLFLFGVDLGWVSETMIMVRQSESIKNLVLVGKERDNHTCEAIIMVRQLKYIVNWV